MARLQVQVECALRVAQRQACDACHLGVAKQILGRVGLVVRKPIDPQCFPAEKVVLALLVLQAFEPDLPGLLHALELLDDPVGPAVCAAHPHSHLDLADGVLDEVAGESSRHGQQLERGVRHHDRIPVAGGHTRHELPPAVAGKVLLRRHEHRGGGVEPHQLGGVLLETVIRHDVGRLVGQAQPAQFHARGHHDGRLAGTHRVKQPGVAGLHDAPDRVALARVELEALREARQLQMRAVELSLPDAVEQVVVDPAQPLAPRRVLVGPCREPVPDQAELLPRCERLLLVDDVDAVLLGVRIAHRGRLHV